MAGRPLKRARREREARRRAKAWQEYGDSAARSRGWEMKEAWHLFVVDPKDSRKFLSINMSEGGSGYSLPEERSPQRVTEWMVKANWGWRGDRDWDSDLSHSWIILEGTTEEAKQQAVAWASQQARKL